MKELLIKFKPVLTKMKQVLIKITEPVVTTVHHAVIKSVYKPILDRSIETQKYYEEKYAEYDYETVIEKVRCAKTRYITSREHFYTNFIILPVAMIILMAVYGIGVLVSDIYLIFNVLEYIGIAFPLATVIVFIPDLLDDFKRIDFAHIELMVGETTLAKWDEHKELTDK